MRPELPDQRRSGTLGWACPSNIALIKYWGKKPGQIPMNPSLSMTLQQARTLTHISYSYAPEHKENKLLFRFEGKKAPAFGERIKKYLDGLGGHLPFLSHIHLEIDSENSFPHSSGIASSASAMGALALCLVQMEEELTGPMDRDAFWQKASSLARLGSGSASRSVYPRFALWGQHHLWENSSDKYAIPVKDVHESFLSLRDAILIVESGQKPVSSSAGHSLMEKHPFGTARFQQARENLDLLHAAMVEGNWEGFIAILEEEALSLHAMMMTSRPGYMLMKPGTLSILQAIREYREETGYRLGFTLDAGANVHLLYAEADAPQVESFVTTDLIKYCEDDRIIWDQIGQGPHTFER